MKNIDILFKEAETIWRSYVKKHFPLRGNMIVEKNSDIIGREWSFSTDLKKIFVKIAKENTIQENYDEIITNYWKENSTTLLKETMHYLLWHEIYHPIEAPISKSDSTNIHQAIRRGILKAEPSLPPSVQISKVMLSQNIIKDFILDNRFYLDNIEKNLVRKDIIPIWDVLELYKRKKETNLYTITRFMYGALYGPETVYSFFIDKTGTTGVHTATKALEALIQQNVELNNKNQFPYYVNKIREVFSSSDRYYGIERIMGVLGPYIDTTMPQGGKNIQQNQDTNQSEGSPQTILQDLLDDMTEEEQEEFTNNLIKNEQELIQIAQDMEAQGLEENDYNTFKNLDIYAFHEFYKKNHPEIKIISGKKLGQLTTIGKKTYWKLKSSKILTPEQLKSIGLKRLDTLQKRSKIPWLVQLKNGMYRVNEYELKEKHINGIAYKDLSVDSPDIVEFYLDSSGSMFHTIPNKVNDASKMSMLYFVLYGFVHALYQVNKIVNKTTQLRFHNFAEKQESSAIISIPEFLKGNYSALKTIYKPDNGYGYEDLDIQEYTHNYIKRAYVIVTDGNLVIPERSKREAEKMKLIAKKPNHMMLHFEIGNTYDLGKLTKNDPNIVYLQVHNKQDMFSKGIEVLIKNK